MGVRWWGGRRSWCGRFSSAGRSRTRGGDGGASVHALVVKVRLAGRGVVEEGGGVEGEAAIEGVGEVALGLRGEGGGPPPGGAAPRSGLLPAVAQAGALEARADDRGDGWRRGVEAEVLLVGVGGAGGLAADLRDLGGGGEAEGVFEGVAGGGFVGPHSPEEPAGDEGDGAEGDDGACRGEQGAGEHSEFGAEAGRAEEDGGSGGGDGQADHGQDGPEEQYAADAHGGRVPRGWAVMGRVSGELSHGRRLPEA